MPVILLNIPFIQQKVANIATTELSNHLNVPVRIGKVNIEWFNRLVLDDLYLEDEGGDVLFEANHLTAGFKPIPLLKGKFVFTTIRLLGFSLHLKKETPESDLNLQFVLDAFASRDTTKISPNIDLQFNSVLIRKGNLKYEVLSEHTSPGKFNVNHIDVRNISAKIALRAFNSDSINAHIKKLSFEESSGLKMNKLSLNIVGNKDSAFIRNFEIKLPRTNLTVENAGIGLTNTHSLNDLLTNAPVTLKIPSSEIYPADLAPFVPAFRNFTDHIELSANISGFIDDIHLERLSLSYSDKMLFIGQMELRGVSKPEETYLLGRVNNMYVTNTGIQDFINNFSKDPVPLPKAIHRLGTINFTGEISGFFDNLVAYGKLTSPIGSIETDILFGSNSEKNIAAYMRGTVASSELLISELFDEDNPFGIARFDISIDAERPIGGHFTGNINAQVNELDYKNYRYENILLSGYFQRNGFDGIVEIDDLNGKLNAEGMFRNEAHNSVVNFTAKLEHFRPDNLNLSDKYESPDISVSLKADFTGDNIDNVKGYLSIDSLSFQTAPSDFFLKQFRITASGDYPEKKLTVSSDLVNGEVAGVYSFSTLLPGILGTFKEYVPALINATKEDLTARENNFSLLFKFEETEALSNTLKLPLTLTKSGEINGHYNNQFNIFNLSLSFPEFKVGNTLIESFGLLCENQSDKINLELHATNLNKKGLRNYFDITAQAKENKITTMLGWSNNKEQQFEAKLGLSALFVEEENEQKNTQLRTEINIDNSLLVINDSVWNVEEAGATIIKDRIDISNFYISHNNQYVKLDGSVSRNPADILQLDLNDVELSYVFDILNIPVLQFGGRATGIFQISDLFENRILITEDFKVQNFSFNQVPLGSLSLHSNWEDSDKSIQMIGSIYSSDTTYTDVNGYIIPVGEKAGLSLNFTADDLDVAFLHPFLDNVATNIQGRAFGNIQLFGSFKKLDLNGKGYVKNGGLGIDFLNTYYTFSDSVFLEPGLIQVQSATVSDKFGNTGKVDFTLKHKHFKELDYRADIQTNHLLVYDVSPKHNPLIYGTVFGSGTSRIVGNEQIINFDINMRSEPRTSISLDFMGTSTATEYDFITFVDKNKVTEISLDSTTVAQASPPPIDNEEGAEIRMNFLLDITPDANIELIMDPSAGDKIRGNGSGSLQVEYGTKSDLRMYGIFNITGGNYNFSLQQLIHKDFKIREGSSVTFQGDPYAATLNIDAIYNLTANIGDLDPGLIEESARTNIPVNCILKLDGLLQNPSISFDLELPGSHEDLERKVKSYVNTEDMMTRQIVYLLVLNKFYTEDIMRTDRTTSEFSAVTSAAISSQISSILSTITDKVQIGTNIRASQEGFNETEFEMLLSSQLLDNRLIFNGNFGYRNNPNVKNVFVGEFDIEYLLTRTGEIRLKAYNHANDMYRYLKQSLTTQGIGIMYKKDFSTFSELFRRRKKPLLMIPADTHPLIPEEKP